MNDRTHCEIIWNAALFWIIFLEFFFRKKYLNQICRKLGKRRPVWRWKQNHCFSSRELIAFPYESRHSGFSPRRRFNEFIFLYCPSFRFSFSLTSSHSIALLLIIPLKASPPLGATGEGRLLGEQPQGFHGEPHTAPTWLQRGPKRTGARDIWQALTARTTQLRWNLAFYGFTFVVLIIMNGK